MSRRESTTTDTPVMDAPTVEGITILVRVEDAPLPYVIPRRVGEMGALLVARGARDVYAAAGMDWAARERWYLLCYRDRFGDEQQVDIADAPVYANALDCGRNHSGAIPAHESGSALTLEQLRERDRVDGLRTQAAVAVLDALNAGRPLILNVRGENCPIIEVRQWQSVVSILVHHGSLDRYSRREWFDVTEDMARAILEAAAPARRRVARAVV